MPTETVIEINNLRTKFGTTFVHDDLNLKIQRGEIVALIGDSGVGKSTLLREIILLEKPSAGSIKVFGIEVLNLSDKQALWLRRHCGMMFQQGALFNSLTVSENVAVPLCEHTQLSQRLIKEIVAFKIALVGLPASAKTKYPAQLSGGMIKRAAVARALALDPEILFLDEPTAGLDPIGAGAFDELILRLRESLDLTVVIVTHDLDLLWKVTNRVGVLADKRVFTIAPICKLIELDHPWLRKYFQGPRGRAALVNKAAKCSKCNDSSKDQLDKHSKIHEQKKLVLCPECNTKIRQDKLKKHVYRVHGITKLSVNPTNQSVGEGGMENKSG